MIPFQGIYIGNIMHFRYGPKIHQFRYSYFSLLLDLDRIENTFRKCFLLKYNKFGFLSFFDRDHGMRDGSNLRIWIDRTLQENFLPSADKVFLLSFVRVFGYAFNPFSVYFCYSKNRLSSVVYEVKNTFGDQIVYALEASEDEDGVVRHNKRKELFVSPFIDMDQTYSFSLRPPGKKLSIRIKQAGADGQTLIATQNGFAIDLNDKNLLKCMLTHPLMTLKVIIGIHWEAFILYLRGTKYYGYSEQQSGKK